MMTSHIIVEGAEVAMIDHSLSSLNISVIVSLHIINYRKEISNNQLYMSVTVFIKQYQNIVK